MHIFFVYTILLGICLGGELLSHGVFFLGGGGFHGIYFHSVLADIAKEFSKVFVPPYIPHKSP